MSRRESTLICILPTVLLLAILASAFILAVRTYDDMARTSKVSAHVHSINVVQPIILAIQSERAYTHLNWATQGAHRGDVAACRVLTDGILSSVDTSALRRILAVAADTPSAVRNVSDVAVRLTAVRATADAGGDTFAMFVDIVYALLTPFMTAVFDSLSPDARHLWHVASALLTIEAVGQHRTGGTGAVASFSDPAVKPSLAQLAPFAGANVLKRFVSELLLIPALQDDAAEAAAVGPALAPAHFIESMRATEAAMYGDGGDLHVDSYGRAFEWFVNTTEIVDAFVGQLSEREADAHAHINVQLSFEVGLFAVVVALALVYVPILPVLVVALAYMRATLSAVLQQLRAPPGGSKCCALVFTDIESSSALWSHGGDSMAILLDTHNDVMRALIAEHKGYEVKTVGDAFFVVFNSPVNAVRFATRVDAAMRTIDVPDMNAALLSVYGMAAPALKVRVGVHWGAPQASQTPDGLHKDYHGDPVNAAARIEAAGHGGQVVASDAVVEACGGRDALLTRAEVKVSSLGTHVLRGIAGEGVHLWQLSRAANGEGETGEMHVFPPLRLDRVEKVHFRRGASVRVGGNAGRTTARVGDSSSAGGRGAGGALPGHCCGASAACSRSPASPMGPSVMTRRGSEATQATYTLRSPVDPAGFSPISRAAEYDVRTLSETVTLPV